MANLQRNADGSRGEIPLAEAAPTGRSGADSRRGVFRHVVAWFRRPKVRRGLAISLIVGAVASGTLTFAAMTDNLPMVANPWAMLLLLNLNLIFLLGLSTLIVRRMVAVWAERKKGLAGAHLHARLVRLFSLVAVTPAIVIATFSVILFDFGLQGWFSDRVSTAVKESLAVAEAYLYEHRQTISADALAMAQDLNRERVSLSLNPRLFNQVLAAHAGVRSLTEVAVFDLTGRVLGRAGFDLQMRFDPQIPDWAFKRAQEGEVAILTPDTEDRVRALLKLDGFPNTYLYVGRLIDPRILGHIDRTKNAVRHYEELEGKRSDLQITFALIFTVVAVMLLLAAVWVGLAFANELSRPIGKLIAVAERVGAGDLSARVEARGEPDEIRTLSNAFDNMIAELESQRHELLEVNQQLDHRSQFIEAVLGGVTAGVVGLDAAGAVTLLNRAARNLLSAGREQLRGRKLVDLVPEVAELLAAARRRPGRHSERTISLLRKDGTSRRLLVRVAAELDEGQITGFVVTFDDLTELLSAQRTAAWADVARRIAHEIKNPLTPIQLSAERLQNKYMSQIKHEPEVFKTCTDIIVRQVGDIGRMVDEFSAFARMRAPVMVEEDLAGLIKQTMFLQRGAHPEINFQFEAAADPVVVVCDGEQIGRALTNLLQNAIDAIEGKRSNGESPLSEGRIVLHLRDNDGARSIEVEDNGPGLPKEERHRLTEPYVTTRDRGSGLGLAIAKRIMEDHGGELRLGNSELGGAKASLVFPLAEDFAAAPAPKTARPKRRKAHGA